MAYSLLLARAVGTLVQGVSGSGSDFFTGFKGAHTAVEGNPVQGGFRVGMMMPLQPTTDFILQLASPLPNGEGWIGVTFGSSMVGPLLIVTWSDGDKVMTSARVATDHTQAGVAPYTAHPISLLPIEQGTYVNSTYISSAILCRGCINPDTFDPAWATDPAATANRDIFFGYAYAWRPVEEPSDPNTALSDHTFPGMGGCGEFKVDLIDSRSADYDKYAALAAASETTQPRGSKTGTPTAAGSASPTAESPAAETSKGSKSDGHREVGQSCMPGVVVLGLLSLGVACLAHIIVL